MRTNSATTRTKVARQVSDHDAKRTVLCLRVVPGSMRCVSVGHRESRIGLLARAAQRVRVKKQDFLSGTLSPYEGAAGVVAAEFRDKCHRRHAREGHVQQEQLLITTQGEGDKFYIKNGEAKAGKNAVHCFLVR